MVLLLLGCSDRAHEQSETPVPNVVRVDSSQLMQRMAVLPPVTLPEKSELEWSCLQCGLHRIRDYDSTIVMRLLYSTENNFIGVDAYGSFDEGYLQPPYAAGLAKANAELQKINPDLRLLVYDAVRPRRVQQLMWDTVDLPPSEKGKFVSNPAKGSLHNYGAAVDVGIIDVQGKLLDMGTDWDDPSKLAYPRYEQVYLDSGLLSQQVIDNRKLLRRVMRKGGFWNIQTEWWHFNATRRDTAKKYLLIVE